MICNGVVRCTRNESVKAVIELHTEMIRQVVERCWSEFFVKKESIEAAIEPNMKMVQQVIGWYQAEGRVVVEAIKQVHGQEDHLPSINAITKITRAAVEAKAAKLGSAPNLIVCERDKYGNLISRAKIDHAPDQDRLRDLNYMRHFLTSRGVKR